MVPQCQDVRMYYYIYFVFTIINSILFVTGSSQYALMMPGWSKHLCKINFWFH